MPSAPAYQIAFFTDDLETAERLFGLAEPRVSRRIAFRGGTDDRLPGMMVPIIERGAAVHFIGFRGEEYWSAVRVWGLPDFYHRGWDTRAKREIADGDLCIFAKGDLDHPSPYTYDDSNEDDDPAAKERHSMPGSFNGRTPRSERGDRGPTPRPGANCGGSNGR